MTVCRIKNNELFAEWPPDRLEPYQNPAYEGTGYPAAGYGQKRNKVVGLKYPKAANPQLVGWEKPQPVGTKLTPMGTLNRKSDTFSRSQIAVLAGLGYLGQAPGPDAPASPEVAAKREAQGWAVMKELDKLYEVAKRRYVGKVSMGAKEAVGLDTPAKILNNLVDTYFTTLRPALLGADGKSTLQSAARKPERQWRAWLDAAATTASRFKDSLRDVDTYTLFNALKFTAYETGKTVTEGVQEGGKRVMTVLDFFSQPLVLGGVALGALAIYAFAKGGGGSVVITQPSNFTPGVP